MVKDNWRTSVLSIHLSNLHPSIQPLSFSLRSSSPLRPPAAYETDDEEREDKKDEEDEEDEDEGGGQGDAILELRSDFNKVRRSYVSLLSPALRSPALLTPLPPTVP